MTKKEKELIALFDGWVPTGRNHPYDAGKGKIYRHKKRAGAYWLGKIPYDTDWGWRMSIVKKIEACTVNTIEDVGVYSESKKQVTLQFSVDICDNQCTIAKSPLPQYYGIEDDYLKLYDCRNRSKEKAVDRAIVVFIKWYNRMKRQEKPEWATYK